METAIDAVRKVRDKSELRTLWEDEDLPRWEVILDELIDRLKKTRTTDPGTLTEVSLRLSPAAAEAVATRRDEACELLESWVLKVQR